MVRVEPVRPEWAQALAEGDAVFAERFGIPVEAGWSGSPEALPILLEATKTGSVTEWGPHLFFDDGTLVGNGLEGSPGRGDRNGSRTRARRTRSPGRSSGRHRPHPRRGKRVGQGAPALRIHQNRRAHRSR